MWVIFHQPYFIFTSKLNKFLKRSNIYRRAFLVQFYCLALTSKLINEVTSIMLSQNFYDGALIITLAKQNKYTFSI